MLDKTTTNELIERLHGIVDQSKFIKNILIENQRDEELHLEVYIGHLEDMVIDLEKIYEEKRTK